MIKERLRKVINEKGDTINQLAKKFGFLKGL